MTRIAVDGRYLCDAYPGIGRYLYQLLEALPGVLPDAEVLVLVDPRARNSRHDLAALPGRGLQLVPAPFRPRSLGERLGLPRLVRSLGVDLLHSPYYFAPRCPPRQVLTLHDLIPLRQPVPRALAARLVARRALPRAVRRATRVLVPSPEVARQARALLGLPAERLTIAPHGVSKHFRPPSAEALLAARRALDLPERYVLHVGTHLPHKNVAGLVRAFVRAACPGHALLLAGGDGRAPELRQALRAAPAGRVRLLGAVPEEHLPALYGGATLFVLPSLEEGFGLPLLEALACGAPALSARRPELHELFGETVEVFEARDEAGLATLLDALVGDPARRAALRARGLALAADRTWRRTAELTAAAYRAALGERRGAD